MPRLNVSLGVGSVPASTLNRVALASGPDITFTSATTLNNVGAYYPFQLTATSASNSAITFSRVSGNAYVENGYLYPYGNGSVVVRATNAVDTRTQTITLSNISGFDASIPSIRFDYQDSGEYYDYDQEAWFCGSIGHSVNLTKQNSTTWSDGIGNLIFQGTYWEYYYPNGCGNHVFRATSSNGNTIPAVSSWYSVPATGSIGTIDINRGYLNFSGLPSILSFETAGTTKSTANVIVRNSSNQTISLPISITTSGAASFSGSTITFTAPANGAETQSANVNFSVNQSVFYNGLTQTLGTIVISNSISGNYMALTAGPINANGQRFLQYSGDNLVTDFFPQGGWNANEPYLYATKGAQFANSHVRNSTSIIATVSQSDGSTQSNRFFPADYTSQVFSSPNGINTQYFIFTKVSTGLQPSSSVALFVNGLTGQNNAFVNGTFIKKTSGANVYYLARNGTRLESPAYSGSVWRFVKDGNIVSHSSTDNSTIPIGGWPSGLAIARATYLGRYPQSASGDRLYISGISFSFRNISYNLERVSLSMGQSHLNQFGMNNYISNVFDTNRDIRLNYWNKTLTIFEDGGNYTKELATFPTLVNGSLVTLNDSVRADFEVAWTLGTGVTGDLFVEPF